MPLKKVLRLLLGRRCDAGLLHLGPFAGELDGFGEETAFPAGACLARCRIVDLLEHARHGEHEGGFEHLHVVGQRFRARQIPDHTGIGGEGEILDEPCEAVGEWQEQQQA